MLGTNGAGFMGLGSNLWCSVGSRVWWFSLLEA